MAAPAETGVRFPVPLEVIDSTVERAIETGDPGSLRVLGYGEVTLVLGWPTDSPSYAVKRLPLMRSQATLDRYHALLDEYTAVLSERGVAVVPTEVRARALPTGEVHAYLVQPLVPRAQLLDHVLRDAPTDRGERLIHGVAAAVASVVDERVGLDGQAANWAVQADEIACFDVSTPMLRGRDGTPRLELGPFLSIYPWALRPLLGPIARRVMAEYHDPRNVLLDFASNLVKEELERWLPVALDAAAEVVRPAITEPEVRRYFVRDRRFWLLMQRLRRADRAWQRHLRHRSYGFLLPPPYRYGPPWRSKGDLA